MQIYRRFEDVTTHTAFSWLPGAGLTPADAPSLSLRVPQGEFSVPYAAHDICNQREKLREQRENVMLVVRAYNGDFGRFSMGDTKLPVQCPDTHCPLGS